MSSKAAAPGGLTPRIFPGRLHKVNRGAIDWGLHNLVAYACQAFVVVVDPGTLRIVQTLDQHRTPVSAVSWKPTNIDHRLKKNTAEEYQLQLVSGDISGNIFVWNVHSASIAMAIADEEQLPYPVRQMEWISPTLLAVMYAPCYFALWDVSSGALLWRVNFPSSIASFQADPFDPTRCTFAALSGSISFAQNVHALDTPAVKSGYRITPMAESGSRASISKQKVPTRAEGDPAAKETPGGPQAGGAKKDLLRFMVASPARRHITYFVTAAEIYIFDMSIMQAVGSIQLERGRPPFLKIFLSKHLPNVVFTLHEHGYVCCYAVEEGFKYEVRAFWDLGRQTKQNKKTASSVMCLTPGPAAGNATSLAMVTNDGTFWIWRYLETIPGTISHSDDAMENMFGGAHEQRRARLRVTGLIECLSSQVACMAVRPAVEDTKGIPGSPAPSPARSSATSSGSGIMRAKSIELPTLGSPMVSKKGAMADASNKPGLVAVGTYHGTLQLIDFVTNQVQSEFAVCTHPLRGVAWSGETRLLAYSAEKVSDGMWKNRLYSVCTDSGWIREVRIDDVGAEGVPIAGIYVSFSMRYFIVWLKDAPLELWDSEKLQKIRSVNTNVDVSALCWCPALSKRKTYTTISSEERFVITAPGGQFHYYSVEHNSLSKAQIHSDSSVGVVTAVAWKGPHLVTGDVSGTLHCWDFERNKTRSIATSLGAVVRIRFSPGHGNHLVIVLFKDGDFSIWDLDHGIRVSTSSYLRVRDLGGRDVDWISANQPIVSTNDACLRVLDRSLSNSSGAFDVRAFYKPQPYDYCFSTVLHSPYLLRYRHALVLKALLQHGRPELIGPVDILSRGPANQIAHALDVEEKVPCSVQSSSRIKLPARITEALKDLNGTLEPWQSRTAERCRITSEYFGDVAEERFWLLAINSFELRGRRRAQEEARARIEAESGGDAQADAPNREGAAVAFDDVSVMGSVDNEAAASEASDGDLLSFQSAGAEAEGNESAEKSESGAQDEPEQQPGAASEDALDAAPTASPITPESEAASVPVLTVKDEPEPAGRASVLPLEDIIQKTELEATKDPEELDTLPVFFDLLTSSVSIRRRELQRVGIHAQNRATRSQTRKNTHLQLLLGQKDQAISQLLETPHTDPRFYQDALKACVIAASHSQDSFETTISHIASHMISQGNVDEGIELLVLVGKGMEACRFLQSVDRWEDATWLAKVALPGEQCDMIMLRWCQELIDRKIYGKAIEILLTLHQYHQVLQLLHEEKQFHTAALFMQAAVEVGALEIPADDDADAPIPLEPQRLTLDKELLPLYSIRQSVFLDYGYYLFELGALRAAKSLWKKAGRSGQTMIEQFILQKDGG